MEPYDDGGQGHPCYAGQKEPASAQGSGPLSGASVHFARFLLPLVCLIPPLYSTTDAQTLRRPLRVSFSGPDRAEPPGFTQLQLGDVCLRPRNRARIFREGVRTQQRDRVSPRPTPCSLTIRELTLVATL